MPERFKVVCTMQGAIQVLSFTFTFTPSEMPSPEINAKGGK